MSPMADAAFSPSAAGAEDVEDAEVEDAEVEAGGDAWGEAKFGIS